MFGILGSVNDTRFVCVGVCLISLDLMLNYFAGFVVFVSCGCFLVCVF